MMKNQSILLIYAHPDDETVFTGGTIPKYVANGVDVYLVSATRGECGKTSGLCTQEQLAITREEELRKVAQILGIKEVDFLGYTDKNLNKVNKIEITHRIANIIRNICPKVIITFGPDGATGHEDHKAIHDFAVEAVEIAGNERVFELKNKPFKVPRVYYVSLIQKIRDNWGIREKAPEPDTIINFRSFSSVKLKALKCHRTQALTINKFLNLSDEILPCFLEQETFKLAKEYSLIKSTGGEDLISEN
ncbi:PIG-L family deacetylase [Clostridium sp. YIM B02555]|uniref:PIG-L deacetylase family protein n=1 Tax=Clostridium sp. YIM B02555 TaxID=2911968 RepID=UPI001EEE2BED|nr:PIG-L family deacetylase [Clostridium sp. YIM B02555]